MTPYRRLRAVAAALALSSLFSIQLQPLAAAGDRQEAPPPEAERHGASLAEKIACVYLLVGGSIMLYYGPRERENGVLTMDGKSEAVGGAGAIVISFALLRDIVKKRPRPRS